MGKIPRTASVPTIVIAERYGFLWAYHGGAPTFELPDFPQYEERGFRTRSKALEFADIDPLVLIENSTDVHHLRTIHRVNFQRFDIDLLHEDAHQFEYMIKLYMDESETSQVQLHATYVGASVVFGELFVSGNLFARFISGVTPMSQRKVRLLISVRSKNLPWWLGVLNPLYARVVSAGIFKEAVRDSKLLSEIHTSRRRGAFAPEDWLQLKFEKYYRGHLPDLSAS